MILSWLPQQRRGAGELPAACPSALLTGAGEPTHWAVTVGGACTPSISSLTFLLRPWDFLAPTNSSPHSKQLNIHQPLDWVGDSKSSGMLQIGPLQSEVTTTKGGNAYFVLSAPPPPPQAKPGGLYCLLGGFHECVWFWLLQYKFLEGKNQIFCVYVSLKTSSRMLET